MINVSITVGRLHKNTEVFCLQKISEFSSWKYYILVHFIYHPQFHYLWPLTHWGTMAPALPT